MSTLAQRLAILREGSKERIPADKRESMHRATQELVHVGAAGRALGEGNRAPHFELPDSRGAMVSLGGLLDRGPVVLTFFRGHW